MAERSGETALNDRQIRLLRLLYETSEYLPVHSLAEELGCSERTVRSDLHALASWLQLQGAHLERKPNAGIRVQAGPAARWAMDAYLKERTRNTGGATRGLDVEPERLHLQMCAYFLEQTAAVTIQDVASRFYLSRPSVRARLDEVSAWLAVRGLTLLRKRHTGLQVVGPERNRRLAMAEVAKALDGLFPMHDVNLVRHQLEVHQGHPPYAEEALQNLVIHILVSVRRIKQGGAIVMPAVEVEPLRSLPEYQQAEALTRALSESFAVSFPPHEVAYIALHLVGAKRRYGDGLADGFTVPTHVLTFCETLIERMQELTGYPFTTDGALYSNLSVHLYSAMHRLQHGLGVHNPLCREIKRRFPYLFDLLASLLPALAADYSMGVSEDEIAYLVLHFEASRERMNAASPQPKRVLVVCSFGIGMAQLLAVKLEQRFPELRIVGVVGEAEAQRALRQHHPDCLVTTVPLPNLTVPCFVVSPFFTSDEQAQLQQFLAASTVSVPSGAAKYPVLNALLNRELTFDLDAAGKDEIILRMAEALEHAGHVKSGYAAECLAREQVSPTTIGGGLALPHGNPASVMKPCVAMARLRHPVDWFGEAVHTVFMLALNRQVQENWKTLFSELARLSDAPEDLRYL
ncbi:transcriptional regulator ManR [Alicyclobacillus contaminans]|uniref:BglG family transcription antiterminator n=1 Tax=Alicyclobacillus contaminans TaxID=392016 RepID=UPI00041DD265|nr:BglG family transcription antiterminator [Alicyclobacillus contaminans]GMA49655.1 transcriptional regulator ManR [Alicyclobacillus contaminans]